MRMPGSTKKKKKKLSRGAVAFILCILVPPVGLVYMWRNEIFLTRGRVLVTVLSTIVMVFMFTAILPRNEVSTVTPIAGSAVQITAAPDSEVVNALSNLEQILSGEADTADDAESTEDTQTSDTTDESSDAVSQEESIEEQADVLETIVYCYAGNGTRYYHVSSECDGQTNARSLTIREALAEGLGACPVCNPPTYTALNASSGDD